MWARWQKYYAVYPYHDKSFSCDEAGQQIMRDAALRMDRRLVISFVTMLTSFGVMLLSGFLWFLPGLGIGALLFAGAFLFGAALLLAGRRRLDCSHCGKRMKAEWGPVQGEREGEYQVCRACRSYVFDYRTSR